MKICRVQEMRAMDQRAITEYGIAQELLMENAGEATYYAIKKVFGQDMSSVTIFCGGGNNGGDGFVVARKLHSIGWQTDVVIVGDADKYKGAAQLNYNIIKKLGLNIFRYDQSAELFESLATADLLVDALLGTGLDRDVQGIYRECINLINNSEKPVVSVDIPSGVNGDTAMIMGSAVQADVTVTYGLPKIGNVLLPGFELGGKLFTTFISFPPEMTQNPDLKIETNRIRPLPERSTDAHKGSCGKVLFVAGSAGYLGAPYFAALSFLKGGGGLSFLATPESIAGQIGSTGHEIILVPQKTGETGSLSLEKKPDIMAQAKNCDMVVVGCGLSLHDETQKLVRSLVKDIDKPVLVDGDGLTAIAEDLSCLNGRSAASILTPHPGEMARLLNISIQEVENDRVNLIQKLSTDLNAHIVLKGAHSSIGFPDGRVFVNLSGNPGMATAGSGDVLAGTIPAMYGIGFNLENAVAMGVFVHGLAGDLAARDIGEDGVTASTIMNYVPAALHQLRTDFISVADDYNNIISII